jgi:hypothetical protein
MRTRQQQTQSDLLGPTFFCPGQMSRRQKALFFFAPTHTRKQTKCTHFWLPPRQPAGWQSEWAFASTKGTCHPVCGPRVPKARARRETSAAQRLWHARA